MKYLIHDVQTVRREQLAELANFGLTALDASDMTRALIDWGGWSTFCKETSLLVFPGNGAGIVRHYMRHYMETNCLKGWSWCTVNAKRIWFPGESPRTFVSRIYQNGFLLGVRDIIIIDDVVSSGATLRQLRNVNSPWIPGTRWHSASWLIQRITAQQGVRGYTSHFSAHTVGDNTKFAPINSLSTLLTNQTIAHSYASRNFSDPASFLTFLERLTTGSRQE